MADNLLDKASILLTPTAYDNGSMLSVKPENGDGDFTFSRGSAATRVNAQGLVENVQIISPELVSNGDFSQIGTEEVLNGNFSQGSQDWTFGGDWTVGENKIIHPAGSSPQYVTQDNVLTIGKHYTYSVELLTGNMSNFAQLYVEGVGAIAAFTNGAGVYTGSFTASGTNIRIRAVNTDIDVEVTNISVKEVAQDWIFDEWTLNDNAGDLKAKFIGSTSGQYLKQENVYTPNTKIRLQFTVSNLTSGSVDIISTGVVWYTPAISTNGTFTYDIDTTGTSNGHIYIRAIGGSFNGYIDNISVKEITDDTDIPRIDYTDGCGSWLLEPQSTNLYLNSDTLVTQSNATSASTYTVSFYGTGTITFSGTHTGTLVGTGANDRVSVTFTATSGTLTSTISGTCEKGQLENLSYATSYIPTNGAIATRLADVANNSGNASLINSTEGVFYAEMAALENGSSIKIIELNDGTSSNRVFVYLRNDRITYEVKSNGITSAGGTYDNLGVLNFHKIAVKWKDNDFALWLDGAKVLSDTSGSSPLALDRINFTDPFGGIPFYGKCKALAVYKEALTDAELQSLTTI